MSGERVVLARDSTGNAARLVRATGRLAEANLGPHALVGGLAVMCRLAAVHRATQDIDTVTEVTEPPAVEVIAANVGEPDPSSSSRVFIDGVRVDVIETEGFVDEDLDGLNPGDQLFIVSHRYALDTATDTRLIVLGGPTADIRVATPSALVGTKAGALAGNLRRDPRKRASDLYDLYRVLLEHDRIGGVATDLQAARFGLGDLVGRALEPVVAEAERSVRWLLDGGAEMSSVTPDELRDVIGPTVDRLLS